MSNPAEPLTNDPIALQAMLAAERAENERLRQIIKELQRHRFGRRAESLPIDQLLLGLEEAEQIEAEGFVAEDTADPAKREARARKRRANRRSLPAHLPRIEQVIDIPDKVCPCCKGMLHVMGEDRSERLDIVPAQFRVIVMRRPKYACRSCEEVVVQAPAAARLVEGGIPTEATVAHVLVSKYADHLPLYRNIAAGGTLLCLARPAAGTSRAPSEDLWRHSASRCLWRLQSAVQGGPRSQSADPGAVLGACAPQILRACRHRHQCQAWQGCRADLPDRVRGGQTHRRPVRYRARDQRDFRQRTQSRSSPVAEPIDYMLKRWDGFTVFLGDGRIA